MPLNATMPPEAMPETRPERVATTRGGGGLTAATVPGGPPGAAGSPGRGRAHASHEQLGVVARQLAPLVPPAVARPPEGAGGAVLGRRCGGVPPDLAHVVHVAPVPRAEPAARAP